MPLPEDNPRPETPVAPIRRDSWTNVLAAQQGGSPEAAAALEKLCRTYWFPLYAYIRRKGYDPHKAQGPHPGVLLTASSRKTISGRGPTPGQVPFLLLAALNHFLSNQRDHDRAASGAAGTPSFPWTTPMPKTAFKLEPTSDLSPEKIFERNWFLTLFDHALTRLREEQAAGGRAGIVRTS